MKSNKSSPKICGNEFKSLEDYGDQLIKFLTTYNNLYNYTENEYVNQFFVKGHFDKKVPREWHSELRTLSTEELLEFAKKNKTKKSFPDSLKKFCTSINSLKLQNIDFFDHKLELKNILKRSAKSKKVHEIERLCKLVVDVIKDKKIKCVIDIGSGKGYLTQAIGFLFPDIEIIGIDNNDSRLKSFHNRMETIKYYLKQGEESFSNVKTIEKNLQLENFTQLDELVDDKNVPALILGLHCCGDLTPYCLKSFLDCKKIAAVVIVSCCYFKLTEYGFPMSKFVKQKLSNFYTTALAVGCFAVNTWDMTNSERQFRLRSFRFALENLFYEKKLRDFNVKIRFNGRKVPKRINTFPKYALWAFEKMIRSFTKFSQSPEFVQKLKQIIDDKLKFAKEMQEYYLKFDPDPLSGVVRDVKIFWCLRGAVSPLVESLVLLDRVMFMREMKVMDIQVKKLFKESISPRALTFICGK